MLIQINTYRNKISLLKIGSFYRIRKSIISLIKWHVITAIISSNFYSTYIW